MKKIISILILVIICTCLILGFVFYKNSKSHAVVSKKVAPKLKVAEIKTANLKTANLKTTKETSVNNTPTKEASKEDTTSKKGSTKNNSIDLGFIENIIKTKIFPTSKGYFSEPITKIAHWSSSEETKYLNESFNTNFDYTPFKGIAILRVGAGFKSVSGSEPLNTPLPKADYIINGTNAYVISLMSAVTLLGHGRAYCLAVIGANGTVYNNQDLYNAAKSGNLRILSGEQSMNGSSGNTYVKVSPSTLVKNFNNWHVVLPATGSCDGLLMSKDNMEPSNWTPPNDVQAQNQTQNQTSSQNQAQSQTQTVATTSNSNNSDSSSTTTANSNSQPGSGGWNSLFKGGYVGPYYSKKYNIPNLTIGGYEQALLSGCGLNTSHVNVVPNSKYSAGTVISVSPKVGTHVSPKTPIVITISGGPTKASVENYLSQNPGIENGTIS